ncbi:hypothetical protein V6N11_007701 [Hibiscus sabdariffa]|uniref:Uncharacterized protein n=1 Tax=Hibiscus sabdariffa TaxID=183260 RepID=A0ABR2NJ43_9ROSI
MVQPEIPTQQSAEIVFPINADSTSQVFANKQNTPKLNDSSIWHSPELWVSDQFHVGRTSIPAASTGTDGVDNHSSSPAIMEEMVTPVPVTPPVVTPLSSAELNNNGECSNAEELNIPAHNNDANDDSHYINDNDHCSIDAVAIFTLLWNLSSTVARIYVAFMLSVAFRHYQQKRATEERVEAETEPCNGESWQGPVGRQRRHSIGPSKLVVPNKLKKRS